MGNDDETLDMEIAVYLSFAKERILKKLYPFRDTSEMEVPTMHAGLQCKIASYLYSKQGAEGQTVHNEGDIRRTFESADVPDSMLKEVMPFGEVI